MENSGRLELVKDHEQTGRQTIEDDGGGGSREIAEDTLRETHVILRDAQGQETPLVIQENEPCYRGVLVVADGVDNPVVQARVVEALKAVLNISSHRITVLPRGVDY
jgi:stage III sporulation protein AG